MIVMTRSQDHVEAINSTLRNAGHPVHCTWLPDARDWSDALTQLNPEMLVVFIDELGIDLASIMKIKAQSAPEMPVLIVREKVDEDAMAEAMRLGAQDVVTLANRNRLQAVAARELRAYRLERALNTTLSSAREYREQLARFLEGSADAITHVQEGIIVDANRAWLELFGYSGEDALTGTPLMDLFEQETHPALKGALVACLQGKWTDHALNVQALLSDGSSLPLVLTLTRAEYENEPAMRICIPARTGQGARSRVAARGGGARTIASTGFLQQRYLVEHLRARCAQPIKGGVRQSPTSSPIASPRSSARSACSRIEEFIAQLAGCVRTQLVPGGSQRPFQRQRLPAAARARHRARRRGLGGERRQARRRTHVSIDDKNLAATVSVGLGMIPPPIPTSSGRSPMRSTRSTALPRAGGNQIDTVDKSTPTPACRPTTRSGSSTSSRR